MATGAVLLQRSMAERETEAQATMERQSAAAQREHEARQTAAKEAASAATSAPAHSGNSSPPKSDLADKLAIMYEAKSLKHAIELAHLRDYDDEGTGVVSYSKGTFWFVAWAARHMRWSDVAANETTHAKVIRSSKTERGKRACFEATVEDLRGDELEGDKFHAANMSLDSGGILKIIAVKDVTGVREGERARVCGVVMGTARYVSALDVRVTAVQIVGMFDTPVNRAK